MEFVGSMKKREKLIAMLLDGVGSEIEIVDESEAPGEVKDFAIDAMDDLREGRRTEGSSSPYVLLVVPGKRSEKLGFGSKSELMETLGDVDLAEILLGGDIQQGMIDPEERKPIDGSEATIDGSIIHNDTTGAWFGDAAFHFLHGEDRDVDGTGPEGFLDEALGEELLEGPIADSLMGWGHRILSLFEGMQIETVLQLEGDEGLRMLDGNLHVEGAVDFDGCLDVGAVENLLSIDRPLLDVFLIVE
jgi:hypothetical protein